MSTVTVRAPRAAVARPSDVGARRHVGWLAGGLALAFLVPFVLADRLGLQQDVYYGVYAAAVGLLVAAWLRDTGLPVRRTLARRWPAGLALGLAAGAILVAVVLRESSTARPEGVELVLAVVWRGVVYGAADGVLLSVFPILAVFAAFGARTWRRKAVAGAAALAASLLFTAVYHLGYADFRSDKVAKPIAGDLVWSAPTLLTLSPVGAPVAHASMHVAAVLHAYETDVFLPPHPAA
jgi:hypothetical protein